MDVWTLSLSEVHTLAAMLERAERDGRIVSFAMDDGLKVKVGEGMWTPPLGDPPNRDYIAGIVECARFGEHLRSTRHRRSECPTFHPAHRGERNPVVEAGDLLTPGILELRRQHAVKGGE